MCGGREASPPYGIWTIFLIKVGFLLYALRETQPYFFNAGDHRSPLRGNRDNGIR